MNQKRILKFLRQVMTHNNREWFQEHKPEYDVVRAEFERGVQQALERIVTFDSEIAHVQVKDCTYRFYRDTRFSLDKSPYKNHLGAYINAKGKNPSGARPLSVGYRQLLAAYEYLDLVS